MELNERQINILNFIITRFASQSYTSSGDLANSVNASIRTVKNDINYINEELKSYQCSIVSKSGSGYRFEYSNEEDIQSIKNAIKRSGRSLLEIPKFRYERVNYIIKKLLSVDYYLTLDDFMDELYVSRSTITKDMSEVREIFADFNLNVVQVPNHGIAIEGSEISKRLCISEYFFHSNVETGYLAADNAMFVSATSKEETNVMCQLLKQVNENVGINMSDESFQNFVIHILIAIRRWKFYVFVKLEDTLDNLVDITSKEFIAAKQLVETLQHHLEILLPESEMYYFYLHFKSKHITELCDLGKQDIEKVENVFFDIYHYLHETYGYIVQDKKDYERYLRLHIPPMVERLKTGMVMRNSQRFQILSKYLCSVHITLIISRFIENRFNVKMNQSEFCYLVLYTNLLFDFKRNAKTKVLCLCGRGRPETVTLLNEIDESSIHNRYSLELNDVNSVKDSDINRYDLVISTVPLNGIKVDVPTYYLSSGLTYMHEIDEILKQFMNAKYGITDLFKKAIYHININAYSRDELFKAMEEKVKFTGLSSLLWESEHIISHETIHNAVFLHVVEPIDRDIIYIGTLKKPMIWNKQWVQVVIFVNLRQDLKLLYEVYRYINEVILTKDDLIATLLEEK